MNEFSNESLEAEIAELNREIAAKRAELETRSGIVSERGALHEVIADKIDQADADAASLRQELRASLSPAAQVATTQKDGYLASLTDDQIDTVNQVISTIPKKGIKAAIAEAKKLDPFLLDAFHDCLVDKLYEELAGRGLVGA